MIPRDSLRTITLHDSGRAPFLTLERDQALRDLSADAVFVPANTNIHGPYDLALSITDGRLVMETTGADGTALPALVLSIRPYSRLIHDYFMLIESYEQRRATATPCQLEPIDMARRGLHNEGAELLMERLKDKLTLDHPTARRFFTLICALYAQNSKAFLGGLP